MAIIQSQSTATNFEAKNTTTKIVVFSYLNSVGGGSSSGSSGGNSGSGNTAINRPTTGQLFPRGFS